MYLVAKIGMLFQNFFGARLPTKDYENPKLTNKIAQCQKKLLEMRSLQKSNQKLNAPNHHLNCIFTNHLFCKTLNHLLLQTVTTYLV